MPVDRDLPSDLKLSETDVRRVLERAVRIDDAEPTVSLSDLRSAAHQAGISEQAVIQAVRELLDARQTIPNADRGDGAAHPGPARIGSWLRAAVYGLGGAVAGAISHASGAAAVWASAFMLVAWVFPAMTHRDQNSQLQFQLEIASIWGGIVAGYGIMNGGIPADLVMRAGILWFGSAVAGGVVVASRRIANWLLFSLLRGQESEAT